MSEPPRPPRPHPSGDPQDPNAGQYPPGPDPYGQYPPVPPRAGAKLAARMGARLARRPEARFGTSLAAAGAVLVIGGVLIWGFGYLVDGFHIALDRSTGAPANSGSGRRVVGVLLSLALVVGGYTLVLTRRRGALATAGVVAGAFGVPLLLLFLSFDASDLLRRELPFSVDAIYLVSIAVWAVSYFLIPGAQGRAFFLGLAAVGIASYIAIKAAGNDSFIRTTVSLGDGSAPTTHTPGTGTFAAIGLIFGLGYYAIAAFLDHRGRGGAAIALVYAGFQLTVVGVIAAVPTFHQAGTGVLLMVLGAGLAWYGGYFGRRFTTWVWAAGFVLGVVLIVARVASDSYTGLGVTLIIVGAVVALGAHAVSTATNERPDIDETPAVASG
jgi:hypothetical protein